MDHHVKPHLAKHVSLFHSGLLSHFPKKIQTSGSIQMSIFTELTYKLLNTTRHSHMLTKIHACYSKESSKLPENPPLISYSCLSFEVRIIVFFFFSWFLEYCRENQQSNRINHPSWSIQNVVTGGHKQEVLQLVHKLNEKHGFGPYKL